MPSCVYTLTLDRRNALQSAAVLFVSTLILFLAGATQAAQMFTINASDSGSHSSTGNHTASQQSYVAGWDNEELRDFFVFDLSGLPLGETVLSVTLHAYNPAVGEPTSSYTGGYDSPNAFEAYNLREVLLPAATVAAPSIGNPAVYNDLGDGSIFGTYLASAADNGAFIDLSLNSNGIAAVETFAGVGDFVLGGHVSTLTSALNVKEYVFGLTAPNGVPYTRQLIVMMTPEPGTGALFALGLVAITSARRRGRACARRIG